jgi:PAS domain-containing protein
MLRSDPEKVRAWQVRSRSNLPRTRLPAGRKPIAARSPRKTERWRAIADASVQALVRDGYRCQAAGLAPGDCAGVLQPHHVAPRSTHPHLVVDVDCLVAVCERHHRFIDANPSRANVLGLHAFTGDTLDEMSDRRRRYRVR